QKDILDVMTVSFFTKEPDDIHDEEITCHKFLIQGKILLSRGLSDQGIPMLQKASKIAENYEFSNIKLASYDILRTYCGLRSGLDTYVSYNKRIKETFATYEKLLDAKANYLTVIPHVFDDEQSLGTKCGQVMTPEMLEEME